MPYNLAAAYDASWAQAIAAQSASTAGAAQATSALTPPALTTPVFNYTPAQLTGPEGLLPGLSASADAIADIARTLQNEVIDKLAGLFLGFLSTQFSASAADEATAWLTTQITQGGSGVNPAVERAIWDREAERLMINAQQSSDTLMAQFANRRFVIPPGAAAHQLSMIERERIRELAKSSRDIAVEAYRAELQLIQFAVGTAITSRVQAISAAGEYIRALAVGVGAGTEVAVATQGARGAAVQAATAFYSAQIGLEDVKLRASSTNATLALDAGKTTYTGNIQLASKKAEIAMEAARMTGTLAAAALNGVNVSFGYSESAETTAI